MRCCSESGGTGISIFLSLIIVSALYTVIPGTTNLGKNHIPVHFEIDPRDIKGYLKCTTMFLPEQIITIDKSQIIQTAGIITNTEAIKLIDEMLIRQLQIGEYDGR